MTEPATTDAAARFARRVFLIAGIYGLIVMAPQYLLEERIGRDDPPAITHPEYFYGFAGIGVAWQVAFLVIARDPVRYRLVMIPAVIEKFSFGIAALVLMLQHRISATVMTFAGTDLVLGLLFAVAFWRTRGTS